MEAVVKAAVEAALVLSPLHLKLLDHKLIRAIRADLYANRGLDTRQS